MFWNRRSGMLAGAAITVLVYLVHGETTRNNDVSVAGEGLSLSAPAAPADPESIETSDIATPDQSTSETVIRSMADEELQQLIERARNAATRYRETRREQELARAGEITNPIILPAEFDWLSDAPYGNHLKISAEDIDPSWSPVVEAQLREYFAAPDPSLQRYEYPTITCRTTLCELAFISRDSEGWTETPDPEQAIAMQGMRVLRFRNELLEAGFFEQPWMDQFEFNFAETLGTSNIRDGTTTIVYMLRRKAIE